MPQPVRHHVVAVPQLPDCDICGDPARWDCPTIHGMWGNLCETCEPAYHVYPGRTGEGIGQKLITVDEAIETQEE